VNSRIVIYNYLIVTASVCKLWHHVFSLVCGVRVCLIFFVCVFLFIHLFVYLFIHSFFHSFTTYVISFRQYSLKL